MSRFDVFDEEVARSTSRACPGRAPAAGEPPPPLIVRNIVKETGEERWLLNKVSSVRGADGPCSRVVNLIEDITDIKRAERAERLLWEARETWRRDGPGSAPRVAEASAGSCRLGR